MESLENNEIIKKEEEKEIDIDEIESILGIEGKSKEISELFLNSNPQNFLEAISSISNSNKFDEPQVNNEITPNPDLKDIFINCSNFFMAENYDKFKIVFPKPVKPKEKKDKLINENKENAIQENMNNINVKNNTNNNNNQNKEDKKQKQKNKKKKKKKEKKTKK